MGLVGYLNLHLDIRLTNTGACGLRRLTGDFCSAEIIITLLNSNKTVSRLVLVFLV